MSPSKRPAVSAWTPTTPRGEAPAFLGVPSGQSPRRAVLLARVSRGERSQDPQNQLGPLRQVAQRLGWVVVQELPVVLSAWDDEKATHVRRLALEAIRNGDADTLAVWAWDRLSRRGVSEAFHFLTELEEHLGGAFYSLQEPFLSTATADKAQRELLLALIAWTAKQESSRRSERLRAKATAKRNRAASLGERATWGTGRLALPAEVAEARRLASAGASVRKIAAALGVSKSQVARLVAGARSNAGERRSSPSP